MTARKTLVGTGFGDGKRPDPEEQKIPDRFGEAPDDKAPEHEDVSGEPPPAPDSEDSKPRGPQSK